MKQFTNNFITLTMVGILIGLTIGISIAVYVTTEAKQQGQTVEARN